jgi:hypothetical protein
VEVVVDKRENERVYAVARKHGLKLEEWGSRGVGSSDTPVFYLRNLASGKALVKSNGQLLRWGGLLEVEDYLRSLATA